jgi:hypothetical protein
MAIRLITPETCMPIPQHFFMQKPDVFASHLRADSHANPHGIDGRLVAHDNELRVLLSIGHFGHLRVDEIAAAVWPDSPQDSGRKMARRTVHRLLDIHEILDRPNSIGSMSFVLTKRGAARLKSYGFESTDGYDIQGVQGPTLWHRTLATAYLISQARDAMVLGEYAIAKAQHALGRARLRAQYQKLPDGLILTPGKQQGIDADFVATWVEVESSFKPDLELEKVLRQAWQLGRYMDTGERILLDDMDVVYDVRARHEARLIKAAKRMQSADIRRRQEAGEQHVDVDDYRPIWASVRLVAASISPPLQVRGWHQKTMLDCLENP